MNEEKNGETKGGGNIAGVGRIGQNWGADL